MALGAWMVFCVLTVSPDFRGAVLRGARPVTPALGVLLALPSSLVLAAAAWAAFRLARRFPVAGRAWPRGVAVHAAAAVAFALLNTLVRRLTRLLLENPGPGFAAVWDARELRAVIILYGALALAANAVEYGRRYRERQLAELRLQASLARAELDRASAELRVLKLQLNPHFLFNSLHAVSALVHGAPDAAERMVLRLGDLLRHAVGRVGTQEVPLDEEVRTLEPFLEVEQIRLGGRLRVDWRIDPAARTGLVPHMVLQPLVENAIKHGLAARAEGGCVEVGARREGPWLALAVRDDGVGPAAAAARGAAGTGIGMANVRARLAQLYGAEHALEMAPADGGGTRVSLRVPWHEAPLPRPVPDGAERSARAAAEPHGWLARGAAGALFLLLARGAFAEMNGMTAPPGRTVGAAEAAACGALNAALVTLLVCTAVVLARRSPVVAGTARRALLRHAGAGILLAALVTMERNACAVAWGTPLGRLATPAGRGLMAREVVSGFAVFAVVSLVAHAVEYARRARTAEAASLRLQASLDRAALEHTSAEIRGLRMQVHPGFLFTALEAVASRVHAAPADAERMVVRLADLLRQAMAGAGAREVPLEEEFRALEPFLEVERIRRGGLRVERDVDDEALDAFVPARLLQPLVMDAAASASADGEWISVAARRSGEWLEIQVRGGAAAASSAQAAETRARLEALYGGRCAVEPVRAEDGGGTRVRLPWHEEPWPAAAASTPQTTSVG